LKQSRTRHENRQKFPRLSIVSMRRGYFRQRRTIGYLSNSRTSRFRCDESSWSGANCPSSPLINANLQSRIWCSTPPVSGY